MRFYWYNKLPSVVFWFLIINPCHDFQLKTHSDAAFRHVWTFSVLELFVWVKRWGDGKSSDKKREFTQKIIMKHRISTALMLFIIGNTFPKNMALNDFTFWARSMQPWKSVWHSWQILFVSSNSATCSPIIISFFNCCFGPSSSSPHETNRTGS